MLTKEEYEEISNLRAECAGLVRLRQVATELRNIRYQIKEERKTWRTGADHFTALVDKQEEIEDRLCAVVDSLEQETTP